MVNKKGQGPANPVYLISGDGSVDATVSLEAGSSVAISSIVVPTVIYNGKTSVAIPGTQVVLASSQAILSGVTIKAEADNTGIIYVGSSTVQNSDGFELAAGEQVFIEIANLTTIWIDASVGTDGVSYVAS